jgi:drug/metabolite transporter (DMT)-like permease
VLVAAAILVPWRLLRGPSTKNGDSHNFLRKKGTAVAVAGGVFFALDLALWNTSVMRTGAAVASLLGNNTPIFVALMSWLFFRRRPQTTFWIGLGLALAGCATIMIASARTPGGAHADLTGELLAVSASFFFAAYLITTERVRRNMDTLTFNTLAIAGSCAALFLFAILLHLPLGGFPAHTWFALIGLGLVSQLAAYYALVYALGHLPATVTSVGLLAQVPCTAILAMIFLGEPLSTAQIAGGCVVLAGILVVTLARS